MVVNRLGVVNAGGALHSAALALPAQVTHGRYHEIRDQLHQLAVPYYESFGAEFCGDCPWCFKKAPMIIILRVVMPPGELDEAAAGEYECMMRHIEETLRDLGLSHRLVQS